MENLEKFIVKAKANGWVGAEPGGRKIPSSRVGAFDIVFNEGNFFYQDSFVGLSDFCGQEHICFKDEPVWSQAYYGYIVRPDLFDRHLAVQILKLALGHMYGQGKFLGGFEFHQEKYEYRDVNQGDFRNFHGKEEILSSGVLLYELRYFGGLVRK